ncbi:MAG: cytidine deaminase [Candidatus Aegiribacteria sp.]|nr:cytidine deaminase [Candidatus Aegiribacteria sp.]
MEDGLVRLREIAEKLISSCYCPYSEFHVAAVIEDTNGKLHFGVNVENASYGLTMCAERSALFKAVSEGIRTFRRILIYSPDGEPLPCGACRQVLAEFCREDFQITVVGPEETRTFTLAQLLPHRFELCP